ncbi:uncharacterized protein C8A04DRAFT_25606 [Dichotomopilus funicola]|uniref:Uncharacterized protein n=1 Tax=Dichotomopilus funicola TaxID=1934379 RepID=A0AAN6V8E7_9PEZI|nr:hypothetical protein C8A04DRAFT_25606 [Dichotomopilus funicola]
MASLYQDTTTYGYHGTDYTTYLGSAEQEIFAAGSGSSPEDFHVHSATEPHFAASSALHAHPGYLPSPTDPVGPGPAVFDHAIHAHQSHLPRSAPTSFPVSADQHNTLTLDTMGLSWNPGATSSSAIPTSATTATAGPASSSVNNQPPLSLSPSQLATLPAADLRSLITSLQTTLHQTTQERDDARMHLSSTRNELYAARQIERRLRVERDEARSQAEYLRAERGRAKQTEGRLRRERNEARVAAAAAAAAVAGGRGGKKAKKGHEKNGSGGVLGMGESQGEESGESPTMLMD